MENSTLYINDERFGNTSYVGTWDEWRTAMEENFREWYADDRNNCDDDDEVVPYEEWVKWAMERSLKKATDEEIANHDRLV